MHENNIDLLSKEGLRLLDLEIAFLKHMQDQQGVVVDSLEGEKQTFDMKTLPKHIEVLEGEKSKLQSLEMVLAVVGTMKAGKSTTINAIVGTEVLPNRNRPMTALPTLIRHTQGKIEPILRFDNNEPINNLIKELSIALHDKNQSEVINKLADNPDMEELLKIIHNKATFKNEYKGPENIFWFLKSLNDLVRLSKELNIDFPYENYDEVHEMPVIEVEFAHLRHMKDSKGRLTLLDTPGPNEAGQLHLRKMLKEQLSKASAVLAVFNYGQLNSDADAEVREELKEIAGIAIGRLYALVNKFDEKDRNGDGIDDVKRHVAKDLMGGLIQEDEVFPISARQAYLANRALHELHINRQLPSPDKESWVEDFGNEAIGRRWEKLIDDPQEVQESAKELWEESLFNIPMEQVIHTAHSRAAAYAIDSASAKLIDMAEKLNNFLGFRESALSKSAAELKRQIASLMEDAQNVENAEKKAKTQADNMLSHIDRQSKNFLDGTKNKITDSLDEYFREGKKVEQDQFESKIEHGRTANVRKKKETSNGQEGPSVGGFFNELFSSISSNTRAKENCDFDPKSPVLKFDDKREAKNLIDRIEKSVGNLAKAGENTLRQSIQDLQVKFREEFLAEVGTMVNTIAETMKGRLEADGFSISLSPPSLRFPSLSISASDLLDGMVQEKSKTVTRSRRQTGAWGTLCGWCNSDDWGWEDYQTTEEYFEIDMRRIRKSVSKGIEQSFSHFQKSITASIQEPLSKEVKIYFDEFKLKIENIRGDLLQGIRDQESSKDKQEELAKCIAQLKNRVPTFLKDSKELSEDVKPLLQENEEALA